MKYYLLLILLLLSSAAFAQTTQTSPNSMERVMSERILKEVSDNISCRVDILNLQNELAKVQAKIKELENNGKKE